MLQAVPRGKRDTDYKFEGRHTELRSTRAPNDQFISQHFAKILSKLSFLDTQVSLAPTHVSPSVGKSYFRISILLASLVALCEKLKREDPNYFSILGLG